MTVPLSLDADHHVHSSFSDDAVSTVAENVAAARRRGLRELCLADHVRRDSAWVPDFVAAVDSVRPAAGLDVLAGVEAKILDRAGRLDLPDGIGGTDVILIADHQFPGDLGPAHPLQMREAIAGGEVTAEKVIGCLIEAVGGALAQASAALPQRLQLAHLFSILPKMGLAESGVSDAALGRLDLPDGIDGTDVILIADHQFPGDLGPVHPLQMREAIASGEVTGQKVIGCLIEAIGGALAQASGVLPQRLQLAHLFSILPKMGLAESDISDAALGRLAGEASAAGALLEVNEKWACPSARTVRAFAAAGVQLVASTDSHDCRDVGVYDSVRRIAGLAFSGTASGAPPP